MSEINIEDLQKIVDIPSLDKMYDTFREDLQQITLNMYLCWWLALPVFIDKFGSTKKTKLLFAELDALRRIYGYSVIHISNWNTLDEIEFYKVLKENYDYKDDAEDTSVRIPKYISNLYNNIALLPGPWIMIGDDCTRHKIGSINPVQWINSKYEFLEYYSMVNFLPLNDSNLQFLKNFLRK
jgi:hypothetical protein